jgi:hypothetical protein
MLKPTNTLLMAMKQATAAALVIVSILCAVAVLPAFGQYGDYWSAKAPMLHPLGDDGYQIYDGVGVGVVGANIYAVAKNYDVSSSLTAYFDVYNPNTDIWTEKSPIPKWIYDYVVAVCENRIYVISDSSSGAILGRNQEYDPTTDTWAIKTPMPAENPLISDGTSSLLLGIVNAQAAVADGKIYIIGGGATTFGYTFNIWESNEAYDPATDSWSQMAPIPIPVSNYASAVIDDNIYVIGGITSEQFTFNGTQYGTVTSTNLVQIYNTETNQWTQGAPMPEYMYGMSAVSSGGWIYVFGGVAGENSSTINPSPVPVDWTQIYDAPSNSWFNSAPLPTALYASSCVNVNGELYVLSGIDSNRNWVTTNYEYTPPGYTPVNSVNPAASSTISPSEQPTATPTQSPTPTPFASSNSTPSPSIPESPTWVIPSIFLATTTFVVVTIVFHKRKHGVSSV